jgi:hypothetical protein
MSGQAGELARRAFEQHLKHFGEDFHVAGETKRAVFSNHKGVMKITFPPGEFALNAGDIIKRWVTEENLRVVSTKPKAVAGIMISFEAIVLPQ